MPGDLFLSLQTVYTPIKYEPRHKVSNNMVCATSKGSDQPAHTRRLIRAFAGRLTILWLLSYWLKKTFGVSYLRRRLHRLIWVYTFKNDTLLKITCHSSYSIMLHFIWVLNTVCRSPHLWVSRIQRVKNAQFLKNQQMIYLTPSCTRNCLGQFREIPGNQTTDVHRGSTLITRLIAKFYWKKNINFIYSAD